MKLSGLSIDVDSVSSHLEGYGYERPADDGKAYTVAIPRTLDLFEELGARCTYFLIGEEAKRYPSVVREIASRGHEVACHSMTHRLPFSDLDDARCKLEVADAKALLEDLSGSPVVGFRAPSWDLSAKLFEALVASGYRYDASTYPSLLLPVLRYSIARRSSTGRTRTGSSIWTGTFGPTQPHARRVGSAELIEVPMCTAPFTRLPYYHTLQFILPRPAFAMLRAVAHTRRKSIAYQFHAVDFLGLAEDELDERIGPHPGMTLPRDRKLGLARDAVARIAARRRVVPLRTIVDHEFGPAPSAASDAPMESFA